jgi:hypothetical protein
MTLGSERRDFRASVLSPVATEKRLRTLKELKPDNSLADGKLNILWTRRSMVGLHQKLSPSKVSIQ